MPPPLLYVPPLVGGESGVLAILNALKARYNRNPAERDARDYGAALDETTDDTAAINAMMADLPATGGIGNVPGRARITGPIEFVQHGSTLRSTGPYAGALVMDHATADLIHIDGLLECGVKDIQLEVKSGVTRTGGSGIHASGIQDYKFDNIRFQGTYNAATLVDCGTGYLDHLRLVGGTGAWNRGVSLMACVSTFMNDWIFNGGTAFLPLGNGWLEIDSACDSPYFNQGIMQSSSGGGTGLFVKNSLSATWAAKAGTAAISANGRIVTAQSGFTFTPPGATSMGDMGRVLTITGAGLPGALGINPGGARIGRVIDSTHAMLCSAAASTVTGAAAAMATTDAQNFAARWLELHNLAVEGSHPTGGESYAGAQPGVVVDDVSSLKWFGGQSASGSIGMLLKKGKAIELHGVRIINNDQHGIDIIAGGAGSGVVNLKTFGCEFSDNSQGVYSAVSQHNVYSGVSVPSGCRYSSFGDYFGDYLVGSAKKQRYGVQNSIGSTVTITAPEYGNLGTDTAFDKTTLKYDIMGLTGTGIARAATPVTLADVIAIMQTAGLSL